MAPPSNRRPGGFSRRRQLGLFAAYVAAVGGLLCGILLIVVQRYDPVGFAMLRGVTVDVTAPVSAGGRRVYGGVAAVTDGIAAHFDTVARNRLLRHELDTTRRQLVQARALAHENMRLKQLLGLRESPSKRVTVARLVGSGTTSSRRWAILAAGSRDGVRSGQPVRSADGLIGRITDVGRFASRVLLLTDEGNVVPVRLARDGLPALATGTGDGKLEVKALITSNRDFRRGDVLLSSGTGGLYPPNVPVALITRLVADGAIAQPLANPDSFDFAIVEEPFLTPPPPPAIVPGKQR